MTTVLSKCGVWQMGLSLQQKNGSTSWGPENTSRIKFYPNFERYLQIERVHTPDTADEHMTR